MTLVWGLVLMGFGLVKWGPLLEAGLTVASLPLGSLLGLFLLGTLDRRANARGALVGMFVGLAAISVRVSIYAGCVYVVRVDRIHCDVCGRGGGESIGSNETG